jgi:hypothetical protein
VRRRGSRAATEFSRSGIRTIVPGNVRLNILQLRQRVQWRR